MRVELYTKISNFKNHYNWYGFSGKITDEDLKNIFDCNLEEVQDYIKPEEVEFIEKFLNSKDQEKFFKEYIQNEFSQMNPNDIGENMMEFFKFGIYDSLMISAVPDTSILLDKIGELKDKSSIMRLLEHLDKNSVFKYINNDGKSKNQIFEFYSKENLSPKFIEESLQLIEDDSDRAKLLLHNKNICFLPYIEEPFFRNQVIKMSSEYSFDINELMENIEQYKIHSSEIAKLDNEDDKTKYIVGIENLDMKQSFLEQIEGRENRDKIIGSIKNNIDPEIKGLTNLAQTMIREYFEDVLGEKFTEDKKERLDIVFNRSDVHFSALESNTNGRANHIFKEIEISYKHKSSNNRNLGFMVHEYAHLLSYFDYGTTHNVPAHAIEEGIADLFGDLVINHYIDKHGKIEIDGKKVRVDTPYETYSGYDFEAAWSRTMLYGLNSSGKDTEALSEYLLGDKRKFCELVFGKENTNSRNFTAFGMPDLNTDRAEIYNSPELDFSNIDLASIYSRRNYILPLFELQNRFKDSDIDLVSVLKEGKSYYASYVAEKYFDGRKLYEIPREEMQEFLMLLDMQVTPGKNDTAIININKYKNSEIDKLTKKEIKEYSFEVLDTAIGLYEDHINIGTNLENVLCTAFEEELSKINNGQSIEETKKKYERLIPIYKQKINHDNRESNMYVMDCVKDFEEAYMELASEKQSDKKSSVISMKSVISNAITNCIAKEHVMESDSVEQIESTKEDKKRGVSMDD